MKTGGWLRNSGTFDAYSRGEVQDANRTEFSDDEIDEVQNALENT